MNEGEMDPVSAEARFSCQCGCRWKVPAVDILLGVYQPICPDCGRAWVPPSGDEGRGAREVPEAEGAEGSPEEKRGSGAEGSLTAGRDARRLFVVAVNGHLLGRVELGPAVRVTRTEGGLVADMASDVFGKTVQTSVSFAELPVSKELVMAVGGEHVARSILEEHVAAVERDQHLGRPVPVSRKRKELQEVAAAVVDALCLPGHPLDEGWRRLCLLTGRYCEPFLSGPARWVFKELHNDNAEAGDESGRALGDIDDKPPVTDVMDDACPLCGGDVEITHDAEGAWVQCQCGFEMLVPRGELQPETLVRRMGNPVERTTSGDSE